MPIGHMKQISFRKSFCSLIVGLNRVIRKLSVILRFVYWGRLLCKIENLVLAKSPFDISVVTSGELMKFSYSL